MDLMTLGLAAGALVIAAIAIYLAPARTIILLDTATSTARAEMSLVWGLGPTIYKRLLPQSEIGAPLAVFNDAPRIASALMTPGLAEVTYQALRQIFALKPKVARFELHLNLGDPAQNRVVETAMQAALAVAPAAIRDCVAIARCEAPGAELSAKFELNASPGRIASIYNNLKNSRAGREFSNRLKRKMKPPKRPVREVRAP